MANISTCATSHLYSNEIKMIGSTKWHSTILGLLKWAVFSGSVFFGQPGHASCQKATDKPISMPDALRASNYVLVKNWDFCNSIRTRKQLDEEFFTRYIYKNGELDFLNDEWQRYRDNKNHIFDASGLSLVARLVDPQVKRGSIESGMLRSKWVGKFGYYEARVRVPKARGAWPAFWLNPEDQKWPPEIDIFEIVNNGVNGPTNSFHFLHSGDKSRPKPSYTVMGKQKFYSPPFDYSQDFHTFSVMWTESEVIHYVDNVRIQQSPFEWTHSDGVDAGSAHVLINLAVGGKWPGAPVDASDFPMSLEIEFVRVWQSR